MKTLIVGLLFTGGILMAEQPQAQEPQPEHHRFSWWTQEALRTQSPPLHVHQTKKHHEKSNDYQINENKTTIVATIPWGK